MGQVKNFLDLTKEEKVAFFQRCQDLLIKNFPDSEYILRTNLHKKDFYLDLFLKYKGFVYESETVALLFNKIEYLPQEWMNIPYQERVFDPPSPTPNCYAIDFLTTKSSPEVVEELLPYFSEDLEYICFIRDGRMSFFNLKRFLEAVDARHDRLGLL